VIPVLMMAYAQMQYLDKADQSLKEVERINKELAAAHHNAAAATTSARRFNQELLLTLAKMIDAREPYMVGHSRRVSEYAVTIAEELSLPSSRVETIRQAALLHDIGKIGVPDGILTKSGKLTADEYKLVMMHVTLGVELLEACPGLSHLVPIIRYHHERWDGRGYPDRIKSDRMPLEARILSLCDAVEAMSAGRPYRRALTMDQIISEVRLGAGGQFDPHLAEVMIRILLHDRMPLGMTSKADDTWARQSADLAQDVEGGSPPGQVWAPQPAASS
jgi:putative nucleotidyltransferase with HDIG domain